MLIPKESVPRVMVLDPVVSVPRLRGHMAEESVSRKQLARETGLSISWIDMLLSGARVPGPAARVKLARFCLERGWDDVVREGGLLTSSNQ